MDKDWFPFFSMMFWFVTKVAGMVMFLFGLNALGSALLFSSGWLGGFWYLLFAVALPVAIGFVVLKTDILHDLGTSVMSVRRRTGAG